MPPSYLPTVRAGYTPMIAPFLPEQRRGTPDCPRISRGLTSAGYDIACVDEWVEFGARPGTVIDPKNFDAESVTRLHKGATFDIPPNTCVLTRSVEHFCIPENVLGVCLGKSTYARCGLVVNVTPLEPGWVGHLVIELSNTTPLPLRVYAHEGIAQILFHVLTSRPLVTYSDRAGKYQNQTGITPAIV